MAAFHVRVVEGGKIVLPAAIRRKYAFETGKTLVVDDGRNGITICSLDDAVAAAQGIMAKFVKPGVSLSEDLIADRKAELDHE
jgi:bifunctional DNA-binding transcriptional regulator/antitoxin component of YhaV-PrlF toxin-antitoxin module